jgi:hypothetical protein
VECVFLAMGDTWRSENQCGQNKDQCGELQMQTIYQCGVPRLIFSVRLRNKVRNDP